MKVSSATKIQASASGAVRPRPARNRRDKNSTYLGALTDELQLFLRSDIDGKLRQKAVAAHLGLSYDTVKTLLTSKYVNCPDAKILRAVAGAWFASERTRRQARMILAFTTGEHREEFAAFPQQTSPF